MDQLRGSEGRVSEVTVVVNCFITATNGISIAFIRMMMMTTMMILTIR